MSTFSMESMRFVRMQQTTAQSTSEATMIFNENQRKQNTQTGAMRSFSTEIMSKEINALF